MSVQPEERLVIDPTPLRGRVAVITGAGGGLGRACATLFAAAGADLFLTDLSATYVGVTATSVAQQSPQVRCQAVDADIRSVATCRELIARAEAQLGPIYALVNNAGILHRLPFDAVDEADFD